MSDPIKRGTRPDGLPFYWFRISAGRHPVTGKRVQVYGPVSTRPELYKPHISVERVEVAK